MRQRSASTGCLLSYCFGEVVSGSGGGVAEAFPWPVPRSCSCNVVRVWDMSRAVPRMVDEAASFTGDIVAATTGNGRLFTAGANGALRCVPSKTCERSSIHKYRRARSSNVRFQDLCNVHTTLRRLPEEVAMVRMPSTVAPFTLCKPAAMRH